METLRKLRCTCGQTVNCGVSKTKLHEKIVQNGLAITPRDVANLTAKGVAVNTQNSSMYNDVDVPGFSSALDTDPWFIDPIYKRGADINKVWELSKSTSSKLINAMKRDKQIYG